MPNQTGILNNIFWVEYHYELWCIIWMDLIAVPEQWTHYKSNTVPLNQLNTVQANQNQS